MDILIHSKFTLFHPEGFLTSSEFYEAVLKRAGALRHLEIPKGTPVLIKPGDPLETLKNLFAALVIGIPVALLNPKLPIHLHTKLLENLGPHEDISTFKENSPSLLSITPSDEPSFILIATSGSLGSPKWIVQTLEHWKSSALGSIKALSAKSYEPWLLSLPLFHVSGLSIFFRALFSNAPLILDKKLWKSSRLRISMIPHQLQTYLENNEAEKLLKTRSILVGGGKFPKSLYLPYKHYPLHITYGMTESCSQITQTETLDEKAYEGSPLEGREIKLDDQGMIYIKGPSIADHKWDQGRLCSLKDDKGFYKTGDVGHLHGSRLELLGREDERIHLSGEKIYPNEIEQSLLSAGFLKKAIVTHILDQDKNPIVMAFVYPLPTEEEKKLLKKVTGSLFFPQHFLELSEEELSIKIPLTMLKEKSYTLINPMQK